MDVSRHLKEVTRYLNIGVPSFTGTYIANLPEEERWMIQVQFLGRTFMPGTDLAEELLDMTVRGRRLRAAEEGRDGCSNPTSDGQRSGIGKVDDGGDEARGWDARIPVRSHG